MSEETKNELMEKDQEQSLEAFSSMAGMNNAWKIASQLAKSTIVPVAYQGNPSNCLIALDMSTRLHVSPMMVMTSLVIVKGTPTWTGQGVISLINGSRRYASPLKFEMTGSGPTLSCYAWTKDLEGNIIKGTTITMDMVKAEGWDADKGTMKSKWKTMPEQMIQYRAASYFGRLHCPDVLNGLYTSEEILDIPTENRVKKSKNEIPDTFNLEKEDIQVIVSVDPADVEPVEQTSEAEAVEEKKYMELSDDDIPEFMKAVK